MFLLLGNSVFSYDNNALIRLTEPLPRSIEMLVAILLGEHPRFLFIPPPSHPEIKTAVDHLQWQLAYFLLKVTATLVLAGGLLRATWRSVTSSVWPPFRISQAWLVQLTSELRLFLPFS